MATLDLNPRYRKLVEALLSRELPFAEIWAFGSRVGGTGHEGSDLDLVVRNPQDLRKTTPEIMKLRAAFEESDVPILVDIVDWAEIPAAFRQEIERAYVVLQVAAALSLGAAK